MTIAHFTVVCLVTWPWIGSEAEGNLVLIQTSLLFTKHRTVKWPIKTVQSHVRRDQNTNYKIPAKNSGNQAWEKASKPRFFLLLLLLLFSWLDEEKKKKQKHIKFGMIGY